MYGTDLMNAKRVLTTKMSKSQPNPENLSLAERILINRRKGPGVSGFFLTCSQLYLTYQRTMNYACIETPTMRSYQFSPCSSTLKERNVLRPSHHVCQGRSWASFDDTHEWGRCKEGVSSGVKHGQKEVYSKQKKQTKGLGPCAGICFPETVGFAEKQIKVTKRCFLTLFETMFWKLTLLKKMKFRWVNGAF